MSYLADTNIFLEILLRQAAKESANGSCKKTSASCPFLIFTALDWRSAVPTELLEVFRDSSTIRFQTLNHRPQRQQI